MSTIDAETELRSVRLPVSGVRAVLPVHAIAVHFRTPQDPRTHSVSASTWMCYMTSTWRA